MAQRSELRVEGFVVQRGGEGGASLLVKRSGLRAEGCVVEVFDGGRRQEGERSEPFRI